MLLSYGFLCSNETGHIPRYRCSASFRSSKLRHPGMKIADQVRQIYDRRPYPFGNNRALRRRSWSLVLEWVDAIGRTEARGRPPARALLAGCGDGTEAFNLRRRLPNAEIVAVDFSARSIAVARRLQRRAKA